MILHEQVLSLMEVCPLLLADCHVAAGLAIYVVSNVQKLVCHVLKQFGV